MGKSYTWIIILLLSDLGTKLWAEEYLLLSQKVHVNNLLSLVLVHNRGVSSGLFSYFTQFAYLLWCCFSLPSFLMLPSLNQQ